MTVIIGPTQAHNPESNAAFENDKRGPKFCVFDDEKLAKEDDIFEGRYSLLRVFFESNLPEMRRRLIDILKEKPAVHVYLGADIGTLYAAYYAILEGVRVSVTLVDAQFLGGKSAWIQQHPLLLNKLITTILACAFVVEIKGKEHHEMLPKAFPRIDREYVLSDLTEGEEAEKDALCSPSNDAVTV